MEEFVTGDRRRSKRKKLDPMGIGILHVETNGQSTSSDSGQKSKSCYVDILNMSEFGICLKVSLPNTLDFPFTIEVYDNETVSWKRFSCKGIWKLEEGTGQVVLMGVDCRAIDPDSFSDKAREIGTPSPADFLFITQTNFFKAIDRSGWCPFLNALTIRHKAAGELIMRQDEKGDAFFLVQKGYCIVYVEKGSEKHQVAKIKEGGIVGEMAVLTGEVRNANVIAKTDMILWSIEKDTFETLLKEHPGVRNFLTELVTRRFASRKIIADRRIGKYLIQYMIGRGGYALVYSGRHELLNMPVAIKMMKHDLAMESDFLERFKNEAMLIARLNHDNIIRVYDIEERYKTIFIVMELLEGNSLQEILDDTGKLSCEQVVDYLVQVAMGLEYAHARGIVHQDIKPANIFITSKGTVKILDFGLACSVEANNFDLPGTPFYMSPEQIEMEAVDERSDIYSLGITVYEALIGKRPYPENDLLKLMDLHVEEDIPDPWDAQPHIPGALRHFILKACRRNKEDRFNSMNEVMECIKPLKKSYHLDEKPIKLHEQKMTVVTLLSEESQHFELNELLEDLSAKAKSIGVTIRIHQ